MERRHFLKLVFGFAAGAAALGASAQAAPLTPQPITTGDGSSLPGNDEARPAVATGDEVDRLSPEEVRWGRRRGWGRRGGGWRRRRVWRRRRPWGWRRRWRRRRRFMRRRYW